MHGMNPFAPDKTAPADLPEPKECLTGPYQLDFIARATAFWWAWSTRLVPWVFDL